MHSWTLDFLACPSCRSAYVIENPACDDAEIVSGRLVCPSCQVAVPIAHGFPMFTQPAIGPSDPTPRFAPIEDYRDYRRRKAERGELEPYAAFFPFNESTRAADPIIPHFAAHLAPGDLILDPWSRTGWTALTLAHRFPEQRVLAFWEGDRSVLGHSGFAYWFGPGAKPENLDILFVHPEHGLPLHSGSVAGLFAHDCWHRFSPATFWSEALRLLRSDGAAMFIHTHLANSHPDPWFDRGGTIRHGREYRAWADKLLAHDPREARIWSELDLFRMKPGDPLPPDAPETPHYNSLVFIGDLSRPPRPPAAPADSDRLLLNPLFRLDLSRRNAAPDGRLHDGLASHLFVRHPGYLRALPSQPIDLSPDDLLMLAAATTGDDVRTVASIAGMAALSRLVDADLLLRSSLPEQAVLLQRFHANQLASPESIDAFLQTIGANPESSVCGADGESIAGSDLQELLGKLGAVFRSLGIGPDRALVCEVLDHPLALLIVLAATACGANCWLGKSVNDVGGLHVIGDKRTAASPAEIALGVDGAGDGLLRMALDRDPLDQLVPQGAILWLSAGSFRRFDVRQLVDAVSSWRCVTPQQDAFLNKIENPADILESLIALSNGRAVRIG